MDVDRWLVDRLKTTVEMLYLFSCVKSFFATPSNGSKSTPSIGPQNGSKIGPKIDLIGKALLDL